MIGKSSSKKLREMNINTIGDLARTNEDILIKRFKSMGKMMHNYANGIDDSPVYYEREASKSISSSTVLPYNYSDINKIKQVIMNLSMEIGRKLRDENKYANTIGVWLKYTYFDKISKQKTLDNSISTDEEIYNSALKIFDNLWNYDDSIRSICIFISNFSDVKKRQLSIFDINNSYNKNDDKLQKVIDEIRNKYGNDVIGYGNNNEKR